MYSSKSLETDSSYLNIYIRQGLAAFSSLPCYKIKWAGCQAPQDFGLKILKALSKLPKSINTIKIASWACNKESVVLKQLGKNA